MILSVVVTESEKFLVLVKSDLCIIFSVIIMKSTIQQCKDERTSSIRKKFDFLIYF